MIKLMVTCRNRLAITKKCIEAIKKHTTMPHQIYVYDNLTNYLLDDHFEYFRDLYKKGVISQITFTSKESTFDAFSKCVASNLFGEQHEMDPEKDKTDFLLFLDNDVILLPKWDLKVKAAWDYINKRRLDHIFVVGQLPGGIKSIQNVYNITDKIIGKEGCFGGSGLWAVKNNFFSKVGLLDLNELVGKSKQHDQKYWRKLVNASSNKPYIIGLNHKLGIHCGMLCGSTCNQLTKNATNPKKEELIKFEEAEKAIDSLDFDTFLTQIIKDERLAKDW
jgi:hypothetical protein